MRENPGPASRQATRNALRIAGVVAGGLLLWATAAAASEARGQVWQVAPAGPCARLDAVRPCLGGPCTGGTAVRSRFDAADVSGPAGLEPAQGETPPPRPIGFPGPGPCADPSSPCGSHQPLGIPSRSPPGGPGGGVIEQPATPGTLPGLP